MAIKNRLSKKVLDSIHCDVRDTRDGHDGEGYRIWINSFDEELDYEFNIRFIDMETNTKVFETNIKQDQWAQVNKWYFKFYRIEVRFDDKLEWVYETDWNNKKIFIQLETAAIGDLLSFMPYIEEFRKKWNSDVTVFHAPGRRKNKLGFVEYAYPNIKFSDTRQSGVVHKKMIIGANSLADFDEGFYFKPIEDEIVPNIYSEEIWQKIPLQKIASNALGLDYKPMRPKIKIHHSIDTESNIKSDYVVITTQSTCQIKYWNYGYKAGEEYQYGEGWREVVDWILENTDYIVVVINQFKTFGNENITYNRHLFDNIHGDRVIVKDQCSLMDRIIDIKNCKWFMGLNSGMSWIAYALKVPMIVIGALNKQKEVFGVEDSLIKYIHISDYNKDACSSCFYEYRFTRDWEFCPEHLNTDRMYECTSLITPQMVTEKCGELLGEIYE